MEITLIRHAKVRYKHKRIYRYQEFEKACCDYDKSPVEAGNKHRPSPFNGTVFVSGLQRTRDTADLILDNATYEENTVFNEVPIGPFTHISFPLPTVMWFLFGRLQWYLNSHRQPEKRCDTKERAKKAADVLEQTKSPVIVICHGYFMRVLVRELKTRGFAINGKTVYRNLGEIHLSSIAHPN